ncbi:hypothetical protein AB0D54_34110 [Streptomyces xanthophaeus]|uniref:hypothetical protein n=1 Tax=Streptomyces xanthophaeus TaxID=67385 RepID=UPI00341DE5E9
MEKHFGTGELAGISGAGELAVDADSTHRIWFDYQLGQTAGLVSPEPDPNKIS